jgi:hypothetical protein
MFCVQNDCKFTFAWPRVEPGYGAAVDERGELAEGVAESVANWRHAEDNAHVEAAALDEEVENLEGFEDYNKGFVFAKQKDLSGTTGAFGGSSA